jgi:carbonic anhydrase/acetyltransferase-like protein (isoleucine patch superfamily)
MPLFEFEGKRPVVHPEAFVAPTATLIGDVTVEKGASVWYGVVLRADICRIVVREGANIQDNSVVHGGPDTVVEIAAGATVAHACVMHGARLGEKSILANNSTMLDLSIVGDGTMVAAGSTVAANAEIPGGVLAAGAPAVVKRDLAGTPAEFWVQVNAGYYGDLARRHAAGVVTIYDEG